MSSAHSGSHCSENGNSINATNVRGLYELSSALPAVAADAIPTGPLNGTVCLVETFNEDGM